MARFGLPRASEVPVMTCNGHRDMRAYFTMASAGQAGNIEEESMSGEGMPAVGPQPLSPCDCRSRFDLPQPKIVSEIERTYPELLPIRRSVRRPALPAAPSPAPLASDRHRRPVAL